MASTRYGRIHHGHIHNNIKFPSPAAREAFAEEFKKYHTSHDHDGEVPRFEMVKASDIKSYEQGAKDYDKVTIDGYAWYEIKKYHHREHDEHFTHYRPPTCCVSPIIVLDKEFIDSGTLERHELSRIFGDMPDDEFQHLVKSVETDGFMDYVIRMHEGKILDGWHRYRAALELNLVRKLMFYPWDEEKEGTAVAFVAARNIERRHLSASQRAQIVVSLNERFGWGGDRSKGSNEPLKTQDELATQANVSKSSIKRAVQVEKAGKSDKVISGDKSASQVITEETVKDFWEQVTAEMKDWKQRHKEDQIGHASKSMLITSLRARLMSEADGETTLAELKLLLGLMRENSRAFVLRVKQTLTGEAPDEIVPEINPYTDEFIYPDYKFVNLLIPSFKRQLTLDEPHVSDNAVEKLQWIRQELIRRGHKVGAQMNVEFKAPESEPETPEEERADTKPIINLSGASDISGCRAELRRILNLQGELNKGNINYADLCFQYKLTKKQVKGIADAVRDAALKSAIEKHNTPRDQITNLWMHNTNLSDELGLNELHRKLVELFGLRESAFEKKFHGLSLREIQDEAKTIQEIYDALTAPESELLKKVLGYKKLVEVILSYTDDDGEIYQTWFSDEGDGLPLEELSIAARKVLQWYSKNAEPFEGSKA